VKRNGENMRGEPVELIARHQSQTGSHPTNACWAMPSRGDTSLFTQDETVEAAWQVVDLCSVIPAGGGIRARLVWAPMSPPTSSPRRGVA